MGTEAVIGEDGKARCPWGGLADPLYSAYHDQEWGFQLRGEHALFERLSLEAFQSGLSWLTILRKREGFRSAFAGFDPQRVARFDDQDVRRLLADKAIVRNRSKIEATIRNARVTCALEGRLDELLWSFAPERGRAAPPLTLEQVPGRTAESAAMAKELKRRGFTFVGPTTCYAMMQATGMVDDHLAGCWRCQGAGSAHGARSGCAARW